MAFKVFKVLKVEGILKPAYIGQSVRRRDARGLAKMKRPPVRHTQDRFEHQFVDCLESIYGRLT